MPEQDVRGKSLLDLLWEQLDQFVDDVQALSSAATSWDTRNQAAELANAKGQAHAMAVAIALVTNPYHPDVDEIKSEAMERWSDRYEAQQVHDARPTLADKIQRRAERRARRLAARNS